MKNFILASLLLGSLSFGQLPEPIVTSASTLGGLAFIAGKLSEKADKPMGISVLNGNVLSSTLTDPDGYWAIVIRLLSTKYSVQSWELQTPSERSAKILGIIGK
jgi:hypothetical protein